MYRNSIEQIFDSIDEGYEFTHKSLGKLKVLSKTKQDDSFLLFCVSPAGERKRLSLGNLFEQELVEFDSIFEESDEQDDLLTSHPQRSKARYESYMDLFQEMDAAAADVSNPSYSKYFWHYTTASNALKIVREGFLCRKMLEEQGRLSFDNYQNNFVSQWTMDKDRHPERLRQYCRFFFRPCTPASGFFIDNWKYNNERPVLFAIDRWAIKNKRPTLFIFGPAGDAASTAFSWTDRAMNSEECLSKRSLWVFNWRTIYTNSPNQEPVKFFKALQSEFLVYQQLGPEYIKKIFFQNSLDRDEFIEKLPKDDPLRDICEVEPLYFVDRLLAKYVQLLANPS